MDKLEGRTYSLPEDGEYFAYIAVQVDILWQDVGGLDSLDNILSALVTEDSPVDTGWKQIKQAISSGLSRAGKSGKMPKQTTVNYSKSGEFEKNFARISSRLLKVYTPRLPEFLACLPRKHANHEIFSISIRGYHLRMIHIEVLNRLMKNDFFSQEHKVVILPHCLRDFRDDRCQFQPGDVDHICLGCTGECFINQAGMFLQDRPSYHPYISQIQDLKKLFNLARRRYGDIGLLGVACIPELYEGMTLARKMGIPAQGVPLNYNRCSRWMGTAQYTNFNLGQLKKIINKDIINTTAALSEKTKPWGKPF